MAVAVALLGRSAAAEPSAEPAASTRSRQRAAENAEVPRASPPAPAGAVLQPGRPRPLPGYAPPEPDSAGERLLWVPRVLFYPAYALSEYVIRRPLHFVARYAEEHYWPQHVENFFTFGPERQAGLFPTVQVDLGLRPRGGALFFWNRALSRNNRFRIRLDAGRGAYRITLRDRWTLRGDQALHFRFASSSRQDLPFWGVGPEADQGRLLFGSQTVEAAFQYSRGAWRSSQWSLGGSFLSRDFDEDFDRDGPESVESSQVAAQAAGRSGYSLGRLFLRLVIDSRRPRHNPDAKGVVDFVSPPGSGLRLALSGSLVADARRGDGDPGAGAWLDYGGTASGHLDLTGTQRTVGLSVTARFVRPRSGGAIPFPELPGLGGAYPMPGFRPRRLIGQSLIAARLEYRWPVWVSLDGVAGASLGSVFGSHLRGFDARLLRAGFDWGIRTTRFRNQSFLFLLGTGTRPLGDGFRLEDLRFVTSSRTSF